MNGIWDFIIKTFIICFGIGVLFQFIMRWTAKADKEEYESWKTIILLSLLYSVILTLALFCLYDVGIINKNLRFNF